MSSSGNIPTPVLTAQGAIPSPPATLRAKLVTSVSKTNSGYTSELPASLVEDIVSTDVGALVILDQGQVDVINSMSAFSASDFITNQLGQTLGIPKGVGSNTSVLVVFSSPTVGFLIGQGFVVSDGSHQYTVQDGGIIQTGGTTVPLFAVATQSGTWAVPVGTVTQLVTSVPSGITLTVTNQVTGIPGLAIQAPADYRAQVLQAEQAVMNGTPTTLRTLLGNVVGVQSRLISVRPAVTSMFWEIIVGGGDPYQVAYAIYKALGPAIVNLVGSVTTARNITATIYDYPDSYPILFVNPPQQTVSMTLTWNTNSVNLVSPLAVQQLAAAALANYVNAVAVGQPMNIFEMQAVFQASIVTLIPPEKITRMIFNVLIDGIVVLPEVGTGIIDGDLEGYFFTTPTLIGINQG